LAWRCIPYRFLALMLARRRRVRGLSMVSATVTTFIDFAVHLEVTNQTWKYTSRRLAHQKIPDDPGGTPQEAVRPAFNTAFFDAKDKYSAALDHCSSFRVVQTSSDAGDQALSSSMDQAQCICSGFYVSDERLHFAGRRPSRHVYQGADELEVVGCRKIWTRCIDFPTGVLLVSGSHLLENRLLLVDRNVSEMDVRNALTGNVCITLAKCRCRRYELLPPNQ
jgi:hypothetical protein